MRLRFPYSTKLYEITIGHNVASKDEVDKVMACAKKAGIVITDPAYDALWEGYSGHFLDPNGHLWKVAWNPYWDIRV